MALDYAASALCGRFEFPHGDEYVLDNDVVALNDLVCVIAKQRALDDIGRFLVTDIVFQSGAGRLVFLRFQVIDPIAGLEAQVRKQFYQKGGAASART